MDDIEKYALIGVGVYLLYKQIFPTSHDSSIQVANTLNNAGLMTNTVNGYVYATSGDTTYKFGPGDFDLLNPAQKILIGLDRIVPGTFLTDWALS